MCHDNDEWFKIWKGIDFKIDMRNLTDLTQALENLKKYAL